METFTWLHLTDLHCGQKGRWYWPNVRENVLNDLEKLHKKTGGWDLVLFTGDLAFSGQPDQYDMVNTVLEALWAKFTELGCAPLLLPVPGNHGIAGRSGHRARAQVARPEGERTARTPGKYDEVHIARHRR